MQLRCIRMNGGDGILAHNFPQFGFYRINQDKKSVCLKLGDPPNDKKRHDKMLDLTLQLSSLVPKNVIEIMQIVKTEKDPYKYVCGIFIVQNFDPHDFTNYIKTYQPVIPFEKGMELIKKRFVKPAGSTSELECEIYCSDLKIDLKCTITQKKIAIPVKG